MRKGKNIVGGRVAAARKRARLTQLDLSRRLRALGARMDRAAVAKVENGLRGVLDYELLALSKALDVSVTWLLGAGKRKG